MKRLSGLFFLLVVNPSFEILVEAQKARRRESASAKRYRGNYDDSPHAWTGLYLIAFLVFIIVAPVIMYFIYIVAKDPATPEIVTALWNEFKIKSVGYLGTKTASSSSRSERGRRAPNTGNRDIKDD